MRVKVPTKTQVPERIKGDAIDRHDGGDNVKMTTGRTKPSEGSHFARSGSLIQKLEPNHRSRNRTYYQFKSGGESEIIYEGEMNLPRIDGHELIVVNVLEKGRNNEFINQKT